MPYIETITHKRKKIYEYYPPWSDCALRFPLLDENNIHKISIKELSKVLPRPHPDDILILNYIFQLYGDLLYNWTKIKNRPVRKCKIKEYAYINNDYSHKEPIYFISETKEKILYYIYNNKKYIALNYNLIINTFPFTNTKSKKSVSYKLQKYVKNGLLEFYREGQQRGSFPCFYPTKLFLNLFIKGEL